MAGSDLDLAAIGTAFGIRGTCRTAQRNTSGHINETYVAAYESDGRVVRYVHQAINQEIFRDVSALMHNIERVTAHLRSRAGFGKDGPRWEIPRVVPSRDGELWWRSPDGRAWRTYAWIEGARTYDVAPHPAIAREAARAFGRFARELADFDPTTLVESIPRFHHLGDRLLQLEAACGEDPLRRLGEVGAEIETVAEHAGIGADLEALRDAGRLPVRVTHNDTKVNNALIDNRTGHAVAVVDLDTVMPGTLIFDYGDLVRTASSRAPEDCPHPSEVVIDRELFAALSEGYLQEVSPILTAGERENLLLGARFMTLIIGVRFLTDHLAGDVYFPVDRPGQNLDRARTQFRLLSSLQEQAEAWQEILAATPGG